MTKGMTDIASTTALPPSDVPLIVDLDGTLIKSDMTFESLIAFVRQRPQDILRLPVWALQGLAAMKREVCQRIDLNVDNLPVTASFLNWLREQKDAGRPLILATASDQMVADKAAAAFGLFDEVMASNGTVNLRGANKGAALVQRFGERGFDYAGNAPVDAAVWARSRHAVVVAPEWGAMTALQQIGTPVAGHFDDRPPLKEILRRLLPLSQSLPHGLVFVPLLMAGNIGSSHAWAGAGLAFFLLTLATLGIGVADDLLHLTEDRADPHRQNGVFAQADLPLSVGVFALPLLLLLGGLAALAVTPAFFALLLAFLALNAAECDAARRHSALLPMYQVGLWAISLLSGFLVL
jgi:hypothetical protein